MLLMPGNINPHVPGNLSEWQLDHLDHLNARLVNKAIDFGEILSEENRSFVEDMDISTGSCLGYGVIAIISAISIIAEAYGAGISMVREENGS